MNTMRASFNPGKTVTVVGLGTIGSHLVPPLGRIREVTGVILIDPDVYQEPNLRSQNINQAEVGERKVAVQESRLRQINPQLQVTTFFEPIESVPLGRIRADVIIACVDSRSSRQWINQVAFRLGTTWVDAAVDADSQLVRVNAYRPGPDAPCLECAWSAQNYALLEQNYACEGAPETAATSAPAELGALAASLQAAEIRKLITGQANNTLIGRQLTTDCLHHQHRVHSYRRNPNCRFDHKTWEIRRLSSGADELTLGDAFELAPRGLSPEFRVEGQFFLGGLDCPACGRKSRRALRLSNRITPRQLLCRHCGDRLIANGFETVDRLAAARLPASTLQRPLRTLGLRSGDVFSLLEASRETFFEIGAPDA